MRIILLATLLCACTTPGLPTLLSAPSEPSDLARRPSPRVDLAAFDRPQFRIVVGSTTFIPQQLERRPVPGGILARGTLPRGGSLIIARIGSTLTGLIRLGGLGYEIQSTPAGPRVIPRSWKDPRPIHGPNWDDVAALRGRRPPPSLPSNRPVEITVMFAYTRRVLEQRGIDGIRGHIATAMAQLETASRETDLRIRFRAVPPVETTGSEVESSTAGETKKSIYMLWKALYEHTDFLDAQAARKAARADILVLLADAPGGGAGLATIMAEPETAVAVVDHHDSLFGLTIPHEIGHIMGGIHEDDETDEPYPWGHGYVGPRGRTIMSNPCSGETRCTLLEQWSSRTKNGDAARHDVTRVLRETARTVATFGDQL